MPHLCPRPCSRLSAAAVFLSVGVVQFIAGIILLRSEYVFLLAGPDFWTSACNIAVGCLLGLAAVVWKGSKKRRPSKYHIMRFVQRNLLLALQFSALIMNMTTFGVFLLGERNVWLSIRLEHGKKYDEATLESDVLTYAYVTSTCCPIICIVIAIVSISGSCFKYATVKKNPLETKSVMNALKNERSRPLRWIYTPEIFDRNKMRDIVLTSSSESLSEDDRARGDDSSYHNYSNSTEEIHDVLSRMAQGKRESILSDSAVMLREMDLRRKNKLYSFDRDGSYVEPMLKRARESILGERQPRVTMHDESRQTRVKKPQRDYSNFNSNASISPDDVAMKRIMYAKSKLGARYKNPYTSEELVNEYQNAASKLAKHYPSQYKKLRERVRSASDISDRGIRDFPGVHKKQRMSEVEIELTDLPLRYKDERMWKSSERMQERDASRSFEETSPSYCLSPDGSDFGGDSIFEKSRRSSWAGEIVPINIKQSSGLKLSQKLIPVANPVVPPALTQKHDAPKISDDSGISSTESNGFNECANRKSLSSLQEDQAMHNKDNAQECLKSIKKYDGNRVIKMASISEEPNLEINNVSKELCDRYDSQDEVDLSSWRSYSGRKSPLRFQSKKEKDKMNMRRDTTIKRKTNASGKALRKIWSMALSESKGDFRNQVVDEDSLIGLSEEELIERQLRTRSIRKVVQQRMKENIGM